MKKHEFHSFSSTSRIDDHIDQIPVTALIIRFILQYKPAKISVTLTYRTFTMYEQKIEIHYMNPTSDTTLEGSGN